MADILTIDSTLLRSHTLREIHLTVWTRALQGDCIVSGGYVRQHAAAANMSVDVDGPIGYRINGVYGSIATNPSNIAISAADPGLPRIDVIYISDAGVLTILAGTPAAVSASGETDWHKYKLPCPTTMSSVAGVPLAEILVEAGTTEITDADIRMIGCPFVPTAAQAHNHIHATAWAIGHTYDVGEWVQNDGGSYDCILQHVAAAEDEPGTGANWETYWRIACQGLAGAAGANGADGADGAAGADGLSVLNGSGAPSDGLGVDGQLYVDYTNFDLYGPKAGGSWGSPASFQGAVGAAGATGEPGLDYEGLWTLGITYVVGDVVYHAKAGYGATSYVCLVGHTAGSTTEPEIGASWATVWGYLALGGVNGVGSGDVLSTGVNGGQSISGGTGASETLDLDSTTHGTKGDIRLFSRLNSQITTGTAPLIVASTTLCTNLNANYLNGHADTYFEVAYTEVYDETPSGTMDGNNQTFTLAHSPRVGIMLVLNGQVLVSGASADFTRSGVTITLLGDIKPNAALGDRLRAYYTY